MYAVKAVFSCLSACVRKVVVNVALLPLPTTLLSFAPFRLHARRFQANAFVMLLAEKAKTTPKAIACASTPFKRPRRGVQAGNGWKSRYHARLKSWLKKPSQGGALVRCPLKKRPICVQGLPAHGDRGRVTHSLPFSYIRPSGVGAPQALPRGAFVRSRFCQQGQKTLTLNPRSRPTEIFENFQSKNLKKIFWVRLTFSRFDASKKLKHPKASKKKKVWGNCFICGFIVGL